MKNSLNVNYILAGLIVCILVILAILGWFLLVDAEDKEDGKDQEITREGTQEYIESNSIGDAEINLHNEEGNCWVAYEEKVYDITTILTNLSGIELKDCGTTITLEIDSDTLEKMDVYFIANI